MADGKTIDAVIRNFEIIGEAANRLPEDFKDSHPNIGWYRIRGFRNRIVHDYFGIDYAIVLPDQRNISSGTSEKIKEPGYLMHAQHPAGGTNAGKRNTFVTWLSSIAPAEQSVDSLPLQMPNVGMINL